MNVSDRISIHCELSKLKIEQSQDIVAAQEFYRTERSKKRVRMIESRAKLDKEYYEALAANKAKRRELWLEQKRIESLLPLDCETLSKIVADFDSLKAQALELHTQYESDIRTLKTEFHYERRLLVIDEDYTISHIREKYARFRKNIIKEGYTEEEGGKDE